MRRKKGSLIPIERSLIAAALDVHRRGKAEFHGYGIAKEMRDREGARRLTAHGTLYRVLDRLQGAGVSTACRGRGCWPAAGRTR